MRIAIMKRSEFATKFRAEPTDFNSTTSNKQNNFCNRLKRERTRYYENFNITKITDNREFQKKIKPLLSNKTKGSQKICLKEGDRFISDDAEVANISNNHFVRDPLQLCRGKGLQSTCFRLQFFRRSRRKYNLPL